MMWNVWDSLQISAYVKNENSGNIFCSCKTNITFGKANTCISVRMLNVRMIKPQITFWKFYDQMFGWLKKEKECLGDL